MFKPWPLRTLDDMSANLNVSSDVDWFWTCAGQALAYREADALFSCEGKQIGRFQDDEIYGQRGNYLGEVARTGRLVTQLNKLRWRQSGFFPMTAQSLSPPPDMISEKIAVGCRDFRIPG